MVVDCKLSINDNIIINMSWTSLDSSSLFVSYVIRCSKPSYRDL